MFEMYDAETLVMAVIAAGTVSCGVFLASSILIPLLQKWWSYATMTERGYSWGTKLLVKISFHKFKVEEYTYSCSGTTTTKVIIWSPFGKEKDHDSLWVQCMWGSFMLPAIIFSGVYFWEVTLILGVLALLTKLSRMVITVKRKLDNHMIDPEAHQDK